MKRFVDFYDIKEKRNKHIDISKIYMLGESKDNTEIYLDTSNAENYLMVEDPVEKIMAMMGFGKPVIIENKPNQGVIQLPV